MLPNLKKAIGININFINWHYFILLASLSCIATATLSPLDFAIPNNLSWQYVVKEFRFGSNLKDYWQNILLFITWGYSFTAIISPKIKHLWLIVIVSFIGSVGLSSSIELTQLFLPTRVSNGTDIVCNSFGGCLGGILYHYRLNIAKFISNIINRDFARLSYKSILLAIAGYCSIIAFGILMLLINVDLDNWSSNYHLAIGNEVKGNRPWNGYLRNLYICDRSLNDLEVIQAFENPTAFFEQNTNLLAVINPQPDTSKFSNLAWQIKSGATSNITTLQGTDITDGNSLLLSDKQWLKTKFPATALSDKLKETSEFSVSFTVATKNINQSGPGRIMSLSQGTYAQNIMIGQNQSDLFFRLRTSLTKQSPAHPEFIVPNVFKDLQFHQILITFINKQLAFYIDRESNKYSFEFNPNSTFILFAPWNNRQWQINLGSFSLVKHQLAFYTIIAIPLVFLAMVLIAKFVDRGIMNK